MNFTITYTLNTRTGNALKRIVSDEDRQYITEVLERLKYGTQEVEQEAEERMEQLEERCKSWKVTSPNIPSIVVCFVDSEIAW